MSQAFRTVPEDTERMPSGIPYIIGNEAAERFSYYGMRSHPGRLHDQAYGGRQGNLDLLSPDQAKAYYSWFLSSVYFFPIIGALIADGLLGKYRTIFWVSIIYCLGHLVLSIDATAAGLFAGVGLIAVGSGGIKPCVSAVVGDQFGLRNQHLLERVYRLVLLLDQLRFIFLDNPDSRAARPLWTARRLRRARGIDGPGDVHLLAGSQ